MRPRLLRVKWTYYVYPPGYKPLRDEYSTHRTLKVAMNRCIKLGSGAEIMRTRHAWYSDGSQQIHSPFPAEWRMP